MGKGDKKTEKGKRFKGSFGNSRPQKLLKNIVNLSNKLEQGAVKKKERKTSKKP